MNRPEVHDIYRGWRSIADAYEPSRVLIGETWLFDLPTLMRYYGPGADELHLPMNFPFMFSAFGPAIRDVIEATEAALPTGAWPVWSASNHDVGRFPTRWCDGDERKIRAALLLLLTLRGTPILYYGDEIGMHDVEVPREAVRDPVGLRGWPDDPGRDPGRTPMRWSGRPGAGFTQGDVRPWLPLGDAAARNVADQRSDPGSVLSLCRDLIALRRANPELRLGRFEEVPAPPGVWAWRRGPETLVAVNLSDDVVEVPTEPSTIQIGTDRSLDGAEVSGPLSLSPWQGVVFRPDR
jgi:alpha-glucosidase